MRKKHLLFGNVKAGMILNKSWEPLNLAQTFLNFERLFEPNWVFSMLVYCRKIGIRKLICEADGMCGFFVSC